MSDTDKNRASPTIQSIPSVASHYAPMSPVSAKKRALALNVVQPSVFEFSTLAPYLNQAIRQIKHKCGPVHSSCVGRIHAFRRLGVWLGSSPPLRAPATGVASDSRYNFQSGGLPDRSIPMRMRAERTGFMQIEISSTFTTDEGEPWEVQ